MFLNKITILNYKNIAEAHLQLSPKINCLIGNNGEGKTNFLDALYFLSFCKSANNPIDSQLIRHSQDYFFLEAEYINSNDNTELVSCGLKRGVKKTLKRNKKAYKRLSEHIGLIPLIMISPNDISLIEGGSEERRRLMDVVISQYDNTYIDTLTRYNKALTQRNAMLKAEEEPDLTLMELMEQEMGRLGEAIYSKRKEFIEQLTPIFQHIYKEISASGERVAIEYKSHCQRGPLLDVISRDRAKDRIMGYSLHGIHRDDLDFMLDDYMMKREGSQGQNKTFVTALKLAQFDFLRNIVNSGRSNSKLETPLLLLDDIFDKLDANRVEQIVRLVSSDNYGQIFITDTNREYLDKILEAGSDDYKLFFVENGEIRMKEEKHV